MQIERLHALVGKVMSRHNPRRYKAYGCGGQRYQTMLNSSLPLPPPLKDLKFPRNANILIFGESKMFEI